MLARLIGQKLSEVWKQPVIVENRTGANGLIATEAVAKSPADGYTMLMTSDTHVITPLISRTSFDTINDFAAVATVASIEIVLVVNPSVPASNLQELIALAKAKPGTLNYGSAGTGNAIHLVDQPAAECYSVSEERATQGHRYFR